MVYLVYLHVYSVITTACGRGLGCLVGCLEEQLVGISKTCAIQGSLQVPLYRRQRAATCSRLRWEVCVCVQHRLAYCYSWGITWQPVLAPSMDAILLIGILYILILY